MMKAQHHSTRRRTQAPETSRLDLDAGAERLSRKTRRIRHRQQPARLGPVRLHRAQAGRRASLVLRVLGRGRRLRDAINVTAATAP